MTGAADGSSEAQVETEPSQNGGAAMLARSVRREASAWWSAWTSWKPVKVCTGVFQIQEDFERALRDFPH